METQQKMIAIIGAGPVGLAAAAHLSLRNIPFIIFESGSSPGNNILEWGHVRLFSPWKYNLDKASVQLLEETDWEKPRENSLPKGKDIVSEYLLPLSQHPKISPHLKLSTKVLSITRKNLHKMKTAGREKVPFVLRVLEDGQQRTYEANGVIDASGTWLNPNPMGSGGVPALGETENGSRIYYGIPDILKKDKIRFSGKKVLVVGSGHSAINSMLDLARLKKSDPETEIVWVSNKENLEKSYGGKNKDALEARGALGVRMEKLVRSGAISIYNPFSIDKITEENGKLAVEGVLNDQLERIGGIDEIIANTGARPDMSFLREVRVEIDPAIESVPKLAPLIDPNLHSCGTVRPHGEAELRQPEKDFYMVGVKSYGRAPTFLMATGYEQVRSTVAHISGDHEAARRVELELPETGVCSIGEAKDNCCEVEITNPPKSITGEAYPKKENCGCQSEPIEMQDTGMILESCCEAV